MNIPGFLRAKFGYTKKETTTMVVDGKSVTVERVDRWLPNSIRIGSIVALNENWFLVNQGLGGSAPTPEKLTGRVKALSSIVITDKIKLVRAFLEDSNVFLQFTLVRLNEQSDYKISETHLFQTVFTDWPEDWEPILGPDGLGQILFTDNDGHEFTRVTGRGDYDKPETAEEHGISDAAGQNGWITDLNFHLYERNLDSDTTESLLIQVEEVREQDGKPGDSACVTYAVGFKLPNDISFIPTT